jgi:hypothetical protein
VSNIKKVLGVCLLTGLCNTSNAGLFRMTIHSRANCLNNESITWWKGHPFNWRVISYHTDQGAIAHQMDTGFNYTWRAHAIHWGEGTRILSWRVWGYHYVLDYNKRVPFGKTYANHCNIIDGWV